MIQPAQFKAEVDPVIRWIDSYLNQVEEYPVKSQVKPGEIYERLPDRPPQNGESMQQILADFENHILPGITHWQHPNFHAYFPANTSVESLLGEMLSSAIGAQCMIWETSPAAAELEQRVMEWLRRAMGLPASFEGVIQDSASSATLAALLTAREKCTDFRSNMDGVPPGLRIYCSTEAHSSVEKAVGICGIGRSNLVKVPVDAQMRMLPAELERCIREDVRKGFTPCAVVAAIGTTGTLAVDPLEEIGHICRQHQIWLHVDAAFAGSALLLPEYQWMSKGMELADSFVFNPHKWLFTHFDCSAYYVKDVEALVHTFEILPEYLKTSTRGQVNDYRDWGVPLGRRFRALKLWFVLRGFGIKGLQAQLRKHIGLSSYFCEELGKDPDVRFLTEPFLNFSCFMWNGPGLENLETRNAFNQELLRQVNESGDLFLTHTKVNGNFGMRMIIGQTYVELSHVDRALKRIKECANGLQ